jgi:hypothetical protein
VLDRIRALYPHLSIGVYALEPGGAVTVEAITPDGTRFAKTARTADEAFTAIFGPLPVDETTEQLEEGTLQDEPIDPFS